MPIPQDQTDMLPKKAKCSHNSVYTLRRHGTHWHKNYSDHDGLYRRVCREVMGLSCLKTYWPLSGLLKSHLHSGKINPNIWWNEKFTGDVFHEQTTAFLYNRKDVINSILSYQVTIIGRDIPGWTLCELHKFIKETACTRWQKRWNNNNNNNNNNNDKQISFPRAYFLNVIIRVLNLCS